MAALALKRLIIPDFMKPEHVLPLLKARLAENMTLFIFKKIKIIYIDNKKEYINQK
ncbi:MAG: hypothetical protein ACFFHD_12040 [Promethearchaeota archaeon]